METCPDCSSDLSETGKGWFDTDKPRTFRCPLCTQELAILDAMSRQESVAYFTIVPAFPLKMITVTIDLPELEKE